MPLTCSAATTDAVKLKARPIPPGERSLGTQENLFAPRQYKLHQGESFPCLAHVCAVSLTGVPPEADLREALSWVIARHPMLSRRY